MKISGKVAAFFAVTSIMAAQPAQACWSDSEAKAASVANLNMMMMVTALRCRNGQHNFLAEYNRFVRLNNPVIGAHNAQVKARFARMVGGAGAERAMDKFTISLANHYGTGHASMDCAELKLLASELGSRAHQSASLSDLAERHAGTPELSGGRCGLRIAAK